MRRVVAPAHYTMERLAARNATPGSARWLRGAELRFGGFNAGLEKRRISNLDNRPAQQLATEGMNGGDRMSRAHHNYAPTYAMHLSRWLDDGASPVIVELGILRGSGLAMWCDLFPTGTVLGLDIDLSHFRDNLPALTARGAFRHNRPELAGFDSFLPDTSGLVELLAGRNIDIVIDDGPHTLEAISATARALRPLLAERFTYFVEDNPVCLEPVMEILSPARGARGSGGLVVIWR